jgi:homocysteine S-methyltransferase
MSLAGKLGKQFVITVELDPPRGVNIEKALEGAALLRGVDAINIADSPMARVRMSPIALAHLIRDRLGLETVLHMTCRDRNLLSLQSDLIGAYALGVENVLALTGDPPSVGDFPQATGVFDVTSEGLVHLIRRLNSGTDLAGNELNQRTDFCIGVAVNPMADDLGKEIHRLEGKVAAGAHFALSQPVYHPDTVYRLLEKTTRVGIPVLIGILPLRSPRHCEFLHNEVPGITIPDDIRKRMSDAGQENGRAEGIRIAREFLSVVKSDVSGVYIMPPFADYGMAAEIIEFARG